MSVLSRAHNVKADQVGRKGLVLAVGAAALGLLLAPVPAARAASTYYAAPAGSGSTCSQQAPCDVVTALGMAVSGDTVVMGAGDYGTSGSPLSTTLSVADGVTLTGDPTGPMPVVYSAAGAPDYAGVKLAGPGSKLADLDVEYSGGSGWALSASGSIDRVIANGGGCFFGFSDATVTNTVCAGGYGIFEIVGGGGTWTVNLRNSTIIGQAKGIDLSSSGPSVTFNLFNTIVHGSGGDFSASQSGSGYVWVNANYSNYATVTTSGGAHVADAGSGTNQTAGPGFVDAAGGDYMEAPASPTIGAGVNDPLNGTLDLAGNLREIAGRTDIGAYEYVYRPTVTAQPATGITTTGATVNATINPNGAATAYHLEYGTDPGYGQSTATQTLPATDTQQPVSFTLTGLAPGTTYHYHVVATNGGGTTDETDQQLQTGSQLSSGAPPPGERPLAISGVRQSHKRWRLGNRLAQISRKRPPVGTTFSFALNEQARVRFAFTRPVAGRRVAGRCVAQTKRNRNKRRCTRIVTVGTLGFNGHAGRNKVAFQGWLSRHKKLKPGRYTLVITATNTAGSSKPVKLTFTIVT